MKKLKLDSLEEFKSFKQRVDQGFTEVICPHCTDNTTCIGANCRSSRKRKSRKVNTSVCLCVYKLVNVCVLVVSKVSVRGNPLYGHYTVTQ